MSISAVKRDTRVADVEVSDMTLSVSPRDGRKISAPLSWFPRLAQASWEDRTVWEPSAAGHSVHWPKIDEDLSIEGLLRGQPAR